MRAEQRSGSLFAAPYTAFLLLFAAYPIVFALVLVFLQWDLVTAPSFAGSDNVRLLANDGRFWRAVGNTFVFLSIHVPLQIVTALALALALNRQLVLRSFWRAAFFLPVVISGAVVAILWSNLYATDVGLINKLLVRVGLAPVPWLTDPLTAMPAIAVMVTWKNVGFYVIIYLAGLQYIPRSCQEAIEFNATAILMLRQFFLQIPQSLIDAARMDGMSELRILFTIFWPLSKPVLSIVAIFTFMGSWNEVLWPLLVVRDQQLMTLPQLLTVFALGGGAGSVGVSLASAMVLVVPVVIAYMFLQRNFIESMAGAGIKG